MLDLENKKFIRDIYINLGVLTNFVQWNNKYVIFIDEKENSLKILDLSKSKIICNFKQNDELKNIKKINHPLYGESLLISYKGIKDISLWTI